ncbi:unnamed protein product [Cyprideis torosa]|uniref:Fucosyltransferase n=1 Tax=Cyprideis torosa TaxID=163714 RepID=A0A7R8WJW8_9CRUS|nr:unnamed protein product [Cyprideis torosa]CAG0902484.1 unnamed protein product [Cyprideis torosa]
MGERSLECLREMSKKYWFYLAFENSVCEEYVTEKLGRGLDAHSIPISMANQTGVRLPPRSYLKVPVDTGKVTDEGIAELAQQMKQLMADREEYMRSRRNFVPEISRRFPVTGRKDPRGAAWWKSKSEANTVYDYDYNCFSRPRPRWAQWWAH